ncbi:hypothetical protein [Sulfurospirillum sp. 1612]|uniref:hypothetical protein n=1 Tax=Sulfurospirillum sp. 1612 TaxID=3094835 RepID=UPI002F92E4AB
MNKKLIFFILIIIIVALAFPAYENQRVEQIIAQKKAVLHAEGIDLSIEPKEGYFVSIRKFNLTLQKGEVIALMLKENLVRFYPLYKDSIEAYFKKNQTTIAQSLEGMRFSGFITVDNLMLNKPKLRIVLKELPTILMQDIKNDPSASSIVLPWLDHGLIAFKVVFNQDGSLEHIAMRNFDEKFTSGIKKEANHIQLLGNQLMVLDKNSGEFQMQKASIESKNRAQKQTVLMQLKDLKYQFQYDDMLHESSNLNIGDFVINLNDTQKSTKFSINNFTVNSHSDSDKEKTNFMAEYKIGAMNFLGYQQLLKLHQLNLKVTFSGLNTPAVKSFIRTYGHKITQQPPNQMFLQNDVMAIINQGFNLKVDGGINETQYAIFALKAFDFSINLKVAPNTLNSNSQPEEFEQFISISSDIMITQNDIDQLSVINPKLVEELKKYAKKDGDHLLFHIVLDKSKISINDKEL